MKALKFIAKSLMVFFLFMGILSVVSIIYANNVNNDTDDEYYPEANDFDFYQ